VWLQLALLASPIIMGWRQSGRLQQIFDGDDRVHRHRPQAMIQPYQHTATRTAVPDKPFRHSYTEHLLQAERDGAQLHIGGDSVPPSHLDLAWHQPPVRMNLYNVGSSDKTQPLRPHRHRPDNRTAPLHPPAGSVGSPMALLASYRVAIVHPHAIDKDQCALASAIHVVL
jgi:hypothetical protein